MASEIRKKLATVVILFLQSGLKNAMYVFDGHGFQVPGGKKVVVRIDIEDDGVICDGGQ